MKEEKEKNRREIENRKEENERLALELRKMRRKNEQIVKKEENQVERSNEDLEKLRKELGAKGGAGEFFGNDKWTGRGGERNWMKKEELRKVLKLLAVGEKTINLKEKEFLIF